MIIVIHSMKAGELVARLGKQNRRKEVGGAGECERGGGHAYHRSSIARPIHRYIDRYIDQHHL